MPPGARRRWLDRRARSTCTASCVSVYGAASLHWAGLDVTRREADLVSRRLAEIVDGFGFAGPAYVRGWRARRWAERWARTAVRDARDGRTSPVAGSALQMIAATDLDDRQATVELLNVLRPTVAVSWLGCFAGLALASVPAEERARLVPQEAVHERYAFAQEVRRTSPFVPALTALAVRATRSRESACARATGSCSTSSASTTTRAAGRAAPVRRRPLPRPRRGRGGVRLRPRAARRRPPVRPSLPG